jgi:hypothetical protein
MYERVANSDPLWSLDFTVGGADGCRWKLSSKTRTITPEMFGAYGVTSVGDIAIVGHAGIPNEAPALQRMFDFALLYGATVDFGGTDRDYGISTGINIDPQAARNKGNINAVVTSGDPLALHYSNMPSIMVKNPGNARIVAKAAMTTMFAIDNVAAVASTAPYWTEWHGLNLHGNGLADVGFRTTWSYRNLYSRCRLYGFKHGWQAIYDAGSHWADNEINCTLSAIWLDNAGDCTISGGDISVQKDGVLCGGGNNTRVTGVTFTGNVFAGTIVAVRLFGGSSVISTFRSRSIHITACEGAGLDYLVYGNDNDVDGVQEIFNITLTDNHIIRTTEKPNIRMGWFRNANGVSCNGNKHGDMLNAYGVGPSYYFENGSGVTINDDFFRISGVAIQFIGINGGKMSSNFVDCATTVAEAIVSLNNTLGVAISGCSVMWTIPTPTVTAFAQEFGYANRNTAFANSIETPKLARPFIRLGAQSTLFFPILKNTGFAYGSPMAPGVKGVVSGISVPGVRLGDNATAAFVGDGGGVTFQATVTAADTMRLDYFNNTSGSPALGTASVQINVITNG